MIRETTAHRHERIRVIVEHRVEELRQSDVRNPVEIACRDLADELGYYWGTLKNIYYEYF